MNSTIAESSGRSIATITTAEPTRLLTKEACMALMERAHKFAVAGGSTSLFIESSWIGNLRWARNRITSSGDVRNHDVWVRRNLRGAQGQADINRIDDASIHSSIRRAERILLLANESAPLTPPRRPREPYSTPQIWSDATYNLSQEARAEIMGRLVKPSRDAGMLAAGYIQVSAHGRTVLSSDGTAMYHPFTAAQYSVTVRDPNGAGSGWAGVSWHDWMRIDAEQLSEIALDKCLRSRNPVAIEPGRYTVILEPQAVADLCAEIVAPRVNSRVVAENDPPRGPYALGNNTSKIGLRLIDSRLSVVANPMDPDHGFVPFDRFGNVYNEAEWFSNGVLKELSYAQEYAIRMLHKDKSKLSSGALIMSGGDTSIEEMIKTLKRGILVTRFSNISVLDKDSLLSTGYTRDGLWLIENGEIAKAIKNLRFTDSPLFALNNVEQIGAPQRVFSPSIPIVVPSLKVRDFNFSSLTDAI